MNYYDEKNRETWGVLSTACKCFVLAALVLAVLHACVDAIDRQTDPAGDLSQGQREAITTAMDREQHIDYYGNYLTAKVEKDWRDGR